MSNVSQDQEGVKDDPLGEFDDDALAEMSDSFAKEAERLGRLARGAHAELRARMLEREATILDTAHWMGKMKPGAITHVVDDTLRFRERLAAWISGRDLATAFVQPPPPPLRADHRGLNELRKRGGPIAEIIDEERKSIRGESQLVLERKQVRSI
jgi:hypothetical protein